MIFREANFQLDFSYLAVENTDIRVRRSTKSLRTFAVAVCRNKTRKKSPQYRAEELEEQVWQEVRSLLRDPKRLRTGMDTVIETPRSALRANPEREAKTRRDNRAEVERKRLGYQEMAAEELITLDELREKLPGLEEIRATAERALEELQ